MIVVVGAGVSGLASARALAKRGHPVCVIERGARAGQGSSTHNSGVIHAGLYYPAGTLKARLCVEGRDRLYEFCAARGLPHVRCGKLIVAPAHAAREQDDEAALERVRRTAEAAGARVVPVDA